MKRSRSILDILVWRVEAERMNKQGLSADGVGSLIPSALRPCLLGMAVVAIPVFVAASVFLQMLFSDNASAASLTLTVPAGGLRLDVNPTPEGTYLKSDVGKVTIKTDAFAGYTLDIKAKTSSDLMNGENKISSISEETTEEEYQSNGNKNTWTWQPSKFKSSDNTKFLPAPTLEPAVIEKTNEKNDVENNYDIYIATKVDNTLPTGEYKNDFVLTVSANSVPYSIKYEIGEEATGAPEPNPDTGSSTEQTIKLSETEPTREDYEFLGWCSEETTDENCGGETKQPGDDITLTNSDNQFIFYAIWKPTILYMQNWDGCNELGMEETITLRDIRDDNDYTIAKLKDGKCWMTQNLRFNPGAYGTLTDIDSDVSNDYTSPKMANNFNGDNNNASKAGFCQSFAQAFYIDSKYGGFYTWSLATAGHTEVGEAQESICPKNWQLPRVEDFNSLLSAYGNNASNIITSPASFNYNAGCICCGSTAAYGTSGVAEGFYISNKTDANTYDQNFVLRFNFIGNNRTVYVSPSASNSNGMLVRCIKR